MKARSQILIVFAGVVSFILVIMFTVKAGSILVPRVLRSMTALTAPSPAPVPLPSKAASLTRKKLTEPRIRFANKYAPLAYQVIGIHNPKWNKPALELMQVGARYNTGRAEQTELVTSAKKLMSTGCTDPAVKYLIGVSLMVQDHFQEAAPYIREAVVALPRSKYSPVFYWGAPLRLAALEHALGNDRDTSRLTKLAIAWYAKASADKTLVAPEERFLFEGLSTTWPEFMVEHGQEISVAITSQHGNAWLSQVIAGQYEIDQAWKARGGGWASEVTETGWQGFDAHQALARSHLTAAWKLRPNYPEAPTYMIKVVMGGSHKAGESCRLWFDRAVAAQFDYEEAYNFYLTTLLPRWGGSHEEMYQFGKECLATKRFDTNVPLWLFNVAKTIDRMEDDPDFWRRSDVYADLRTMFNGYLASAPGKRKENLSLWLAVDWRSGRYDKARSLLKKLGDDIDSYAFEQIFIIRHDRPVSEIYAMTGPLKAQLIKANRLSITDQANKALPILETALKENREAKAETYLRERLAAIRVEAGMAKDWTPLPTEELYGWEEYFAYWAALPEATLRLDDAPRIGALVWSGQTPERFEVSGDLEFTGGSPKLAAGLAVGFKKNAFGQASTCLISRGGTVTITSYKSTPVIGKIESPADRYPFLIRFEGQQVTVLVNGKQVVQGKVDRNPSPESLPGYLALYVKTAVTNEGNKTVQFKDLKMRRL